MKLFSIFILCASVCGIGCAGTLISMFQHWTLRKKLAVKDPYKFDSDQLRLDEIGFRITNFVIVMAIGSAGLLILMAYIIFDFLA